MVLLVPFMASANEGIGGSFLRDERLQWRDLLYTMLRGDRKAGSFGATSQQLGGRVIAQSVDERRQA
jgi:hypothetical protein